MIYLRRVYRPLKIYVVDAETAVIDISQDNYDPINCSICEIGIVNVDLATGNIEYVFDSICQEKKGCSPDSWIFKETTLTYEDVLKSNFLHDIQSKIQGIFDEGIPVTSWSHDFDFLHLEHPSRGFTIPVKFWDPKITLTNFLKISNPHHSGYKWPRVDEAFEYFNPNTALTYSHRAIQDAKVEADIIFRAVQRWPILLERWQDFV